MVCSRFSEDSLGSLRGIQEVMKTGLKQDEERNGVLSRFLLVQQSCVERNNLGGWEALGGSEGFIHFGLHWPGRENYKSVLEHEGCGLD